jgi:hypothetical protein
VEAYQIAFVFGNCSRQIVKPDFLAYATQVLESMNVTAGEGFEILAVSELQVHLAAMRFDQTEGVELAHGAVISESIKVVPIDVAAFAGGGFNAHVRTTSCGTPTHRMEIVFQDRNATLVAELPEALCDHGRGGGWVFLEQLGDGGLEGIQFAGAIPAARCRHWSGQILGYGAAADVQVSGDFA